MPFENGNLWYFDEDPVAWSKVELGRLLDDQTGHLRWQNDSCCHQSPSTVSSAHGDKPGKYGLGTITSTIESQDRWYNYQR